MLVANKHKILEISNRYTSASPSRDDYVQLCTPELLIISLNIHDDILMKSCLRLLISVSNVRSSLNRGAVWHADALLLTAYMTSDVCDQKCDGPTNAWVVQCLSWKTISVRWFGRDYWHGGSADNSIKQPITPSILITRGWITRLWHQHTKFAIAIILNFVSTLNFISIHSPSTYKLSMIRFVHKVHFDVDF